MAAESQRLISTLKRSLRAQGLTYKDVAAALELSESSVKRLFSDGGLSLDRLAEVCALANLSIEALARLASDGEGNASSLSLAQEQTLAKDPMLLTYFCLLLSGWSSDEIEAEYQVDVLATTRLAAALDKVGLIELLQPGNRIRLTTARTIHWRKDGPVRREYERLARQEFLDGSFANANDNESKSSFRTLTGELSDESIEVMQRKLDALRRSFEELVAVDSRLEPARRTGMGMLLAIRPWTFSVFTARQRNE